MYVDVEKVLIGWLSDRFPAARVCAELPADLPEQTIQVVRLGGGRPAVPFDDANVDIDCYAGNRMAARDLAEQVSHALMYELPGHVADGAIFLAADCFSAPSWAPYDNTTVRRMTAAYRIRTHNPI
jgi:hypothetical protein